MQLQMEMLCLGSSCTSALFISASATVCLFSCIHACVCILSATFRQVLLVLFPLIVSKIILSHPLGHTTSQAFYQYVCVLIFLLHVQTCSAFRRHVDAGDRDMLALHRHVRALHDKAAGTCTHTHPSLTFNTHKNTCVSSYIWKISLSLSHTHTHTQARLCVN